MYFYLFYSTSPVAQWQKICLQYGKGDVGSILGSGRSPGGGPGNVLWYSCLENPMDRGAWGHRPQSCKELDMTEVTEHDLSNRNLKKQENKIIN